MIQLVMAPPRAADAKEPEAKVGAGAGGACGAGGAPAATGVPKVANVPNVYAPAAAAMPVRRPACSAVRRLMADMRAIMPSDGVRARRLISRKRDAKTP